MKGITSAELIPRCLSGGAPMTMNLRAELLIPLCGRDEADTQRQSVTQTSSELTQNEYFVFGVGAGMNTPAMACGSFWRHGTLKIGRMRLYHINLNEDVTTKEIQ